MKPETITPGVPFLVRENGPCRTILSAGAGTFAQTRIYEPQRHLIEGDIASETVADNWVANTNPDGQQELQDAFAQTRKNALRAAQAKNVELDW